MGRMVLTLVLSLLLSQATGDAAPKTGDDAGAPPTAAPATRRPKPRTPERWTLDYQPGPMRLYRDASSGKLYWYATFTIVNRTGVDRDVAPRWEMMDDAGRMHAEGRDVPSEIGRAIAKLLHDPSLVDGRSAFGTIGRGPENARVGFVVFPACGMEDRHFTLFVGGLSSEHDNVKDAKTGQPATVRKALQIEYRIPGDPAHLDGEVPLALPESGESNPRWIFR